MEEKQGFKYLRDVLFRSCEDDGESPVNEFRFFYWDLAFSVHIEKGNVGSAVQLISLSKALFWYDNFYLYGRMLQECFQSIFVVICFRKDKKR